MCGRITDRKIVTYGFNQLADIRADNVRMTEEGSVYDVTVNDRVTGEARVLKGIRLPMPGRHNVQNSLVVFAMAQEMGIADDIVRKALSGFAGVRRRFTKVGEAGGISIIDDYAHHPVEISAVLEAAQEISAGRVIAVVQPHRYSRLANLFDEFCTCFNNADSVIVADIYAAGEDPIDGIGRDALVEGLRRHGQREVVALAGPEHLAAVVAAQAKAGDLVICLGAGNITAWAQALPDELSKLVAERTLREVGK